MRRLVPTIVVAILAVSLAGLGPEGPGHGREESWGPAAAEAAPVPRVRLPVHPPEVQVPRPPSLDPPIPIPDEAVPGGQAAEDLRQAREDAAEAGLDLAEASSDEEEGIPITEIVVLVVVLVFLGAAWLAYREQRGGAS